MIPTAFLRSAPLILVLAAAPLLAGSQCAFFFSSGGGSEDKDEDEQVIVVATGNFGAIPVAGANYTSGSVSGVTGSNGEFQYETNQPVQFSIGDIALGRPVAGKAIITPLDLVAGGAAADNPAVINIERLLQSLDTQPGDGVITIPPKVRARAVRSDPALSSAIEFLDFSDNTAFANAASQLVAVLTQDYPVTGVLVDAQTARRTVDKAM